MPTLSFEGETHEEIVRKVRRWLLSAEASPEHLAAGELVEHLSELTKDALSVIAAAAPEPVAHSEVVKGLAHMGYEITDQVTHAALSGLKAVSELSGESVLKRVEDATRTVTYEMGAAAARRFLRVLKP